MGDTACEGPYRVGCNCIDDLDSTLTGHDLNLIGLTCK